VHEGAHATCCGLPGSPGEAETILVARDLELARLTGAHVHIAHVSAARSVELIRDAKDAGVRVSAEVTPHHLALTDAVIRGYDTNTKMAPPLRSARDREGLRDGLADGTLDCVATDHAPHAAYEKDVEYTAAPFGVVGMSICYDLRFPELYRAFIERDARWIMVPSAFARETGKDHWEVLLRARAIESQCFVVAPAQCGRHSADRASYGRSMIIDPWGLVLAQAGDEPCVLVAECREEDLARVRRSIPALKHRRLPSSTSR